MLPGVEGVQCMLQRPAHLHTSPQGCQGLHTSVCLRTSLSFASPLTQAVRCEVHALVAATTPTPTLTSPTLSVPAPASQGVA